jgi:spore maturation protein SpmA
MLNALWTVMLLVSVACGAWNHRLAEVSDASTRSATQAASLALGLVGVMALWLGLMRVLHEAGLMRLIARALRPIMTWLFPDVPKDHPALGMMVLNMASNMLGLGNAATPFGLRAMQELDTLNPRKGVASNAMVLFLAINTSGLAVLPTGMIALRAALGSAAPSAIFLPTVLSTLTAAAAGIVAARLLGPLMPQAHYPQSLEAPAAVPVEVPTAGADEGITVRPLGAKERVWVSLGWLVFVGSLGVALWRGATWPLTDGGAPPGYAHALREAAGTWPLLIIMVLFVLAGASRGVAVYDALVTGAKEGFAVALRIIPYLVAMLTVVGMLRASGAIDTFARLVGPATEWVGMPAEALPMALLRPLTGTGAYGIAADIMRAQGPDSLVGQIVSTIMGTTETTFYVLALYLGAVGIKQARHALLTCIIADVAGTLMAVWSCRLLLGAP